MLAELTGQGGQAALRPELPALRPELPAVAVDQRGRGFCPLPADAGQLRGCEVFVQDLLRLLEVKPEPVLLMGHSMGGAVVPQSYRGRGAFTDWPGAALAAGYHLPGAHRLRCPGFSAGAGLTLPPRS